jgi:ATP-dependent Clp protease ATP-binding subunit ClpC
MFERFTDRARQSIVLGQEEARSFGHDFFGTEHLLLGLLVEGTGVGGRALDQLGITLDDVRGDVERVIGRMAAEPEGDIPFTPRAKAALEASLEESAAMGHTYIGTEHVLLGLLHQPEGVAGQILQQRASADAVRAKVVEILATMGL